MDLKMKGSDVRKYHRYQNQSMMTLANSNHAEPTKKAIEAEDPAFHPLPSANHRKYLFALPFSTQIPTLLSHLTTRFAALIIHAEQDPKGAQILLEGLRMPGVRSALAKVLDYFVFCCSRGLRFGLLEETYNVILINIRREVIENRCIISVTNPYRRPEMQPLFAAQVLEPIQEELKSLSKLEMGPVGESAANPYLNESSPTQLEIHIHKKIYNLFILPEIKDFNRYKNIFLHSQEKISTEMQRHRARLALPAPPTKKGLPSPAQLIELFNAETAALMNCIRNSYKEEEHPETSYLHSLVTSEIAQEIAFYTIEETLCLHELPALKEIYYLHTAEQCEAYNKQMDFLNANCTDAECFDHLQLREKYRLPREAKPYHSAIQRLKMVEHCLSFREILLVIQQTFSEVKTDCLVSHAGKVELSSMDQLLPVMIFVTVRAGIRNFPVIVKLIDDYVRSKSVFELEERVITTLYVAIEDISRSSSWDKPKKEQ